MCHFQFTSWPDYGTPDSALSMLQFLQCVREKQVRLNASILILLFIISIMFLVLTASPGGDGDGDGSSLAGPPPRPSHGRSLQCRHWKDRWVVVVVVVEVVVMVEAVSSLESC